MSLRIGTCSWKYESWKGIFYSKDAHTNYLAEYSQKLNTVEIDQWFWSLGRTSVRLPERKTVLEYVRSVPEDFKFTVKVPNSITLTHHYRKGKVALPEPNPHFLSADLFHAFLESIEPMWSRLGPLMFQFEYLNKQKMASLRAFLEALDRFFDHCPDEFQYAIETRNPNYLSKDYFEFLAQRDLGHVFLQGYYMPPIFETFRNFQSLLNNFTVIRLHGPNRKEIEMKTRAVWNALAEPKEEDLRATVSMIEKLLNNNISVYLNVNNHYEGSAPLTIERIQGLLLEKGINGGELD